MTFQEIDLEVHEEPAHWVNFDLNGTGKTVLGFSVKLLGWSIRNLSSTTLATLDIYDGTDTSGAVVFPITLQSNESSREWFWPGGVLLKNSVYVNVTAQEVKGALFYRHIRA